MRWFMDISYPVMKAMRSRRAVEAAREPATEMDFEELRNFRQAIVVTYRRSGEPMPTPINHAVSDDGKLYFRSEPHVGKMNRIRNNPRVLVVPCTFRGKPRGAAAEGIARELSGAEAERAFELINSNWGAVMRPYERGLDLLGVPEAYVEVVPVAHVADSEPLIYDDSDPPLAPRTPSM
jgi:PPOX class probable F420-dependent enzyme